MIIQLLTNQPERLAPYIDAQPIVIVMQSGVYAIRQLLVLYPALTLYALSSDVAASGLNISDNISYISGSEWVNLCALHHPVITLQ